MTTTQQRIDSGFGAQSTTNDVLGEIDLTGRTALVTGGYSGLGLETTRALAHAGAQVIVPARRRAAAQETLNDLPNTEVHELDLAQLESVRAFSARFLEAGRTLDIVIANAGIMACPETRVGPGWEAQFAVNHLGHYALVNLLWPRHRRRRRPRRRRLIRSSSHHGHSLGRHPLPDELREMDGLRPGQDGKRAVRRRPGRARPTQRRPRLRHPPGKHPHPAAAPPFAARDGRRRLDRRGRHGVDPSFKTPEQGAATQVWAATSPQLADRGGVYCEDCDIARIADGSDTVPGGVRPYAIDDDAADRLWAASAGMTGTDAFRRS